MRKSLKEEVEKPCKDGKERSLVVRHSELQFRHADLPMSCQMQLAPARGSRSARCAQTAWRCASRRLGVVFMHEHPQLESRGAGSGSHSNRSCCLLTSFFAVAVATPQDACPATALGRVAQVFPCRDDEVGSPFRGRAKAPEAE